MKIISILSLLLTSCVVSSECDINTRGLCVIFEGESISKTHITESIDILQEELDKYFANAPNLQTLFKENKLVVVFVDYDMTKDCVFVERNIYKCDDIRGVNYSSKYILVEWTKCVGQSAFIHELLHTVEYKLYNIGIRGSSHQGPLFNDNMINKRDSIETKTNNRIRYEICIGV